MSFTFAELKTAIQDYTEYDESGFVTNLPIFIRQAEERILKNVQLSFFRKNVTGLLSSGNKYLSCPADFLAPYSLSFINSSSEHVFLQFKDPSFIQTMNPDPSTTGSPRFYAQFDVDNFIVGPTPNGNFNAELHYLYRPASLTAGADSGTTWLSTNADVALLYGCLLEAYIYMKGEADLVALYDKRFLEALTSLKIFGEAKEVTDEYTTGKVIRQKQ